MIECSKFHQTKTGKIDPDEIIEGMQTLEELKAYFRDHHDNGFITLKDFSYCLIKLDEITRYLVKRSDYKFPPHSPRY